MRAPMRRFQSPGYSAGELASHGRFCERHSGTRLWRGPGNCVVRSGSVCPPLRVLRSPPRPLPLAGRARVGVLAPLLPRLALTPPPPTPPRKGEESSARRFRPPSLALPLPAASRRRPSRRRSSARAVRAARAQSRRRGFRPTGSTRRAGPARASGSRASGAAPRRPSRSPSRRASRAPHRRARA